MLDTYGLCLACVLVLQYLWLEEGGKAKARVEKQPASPESSQISTIEMRKKKCRSINPNLGMQKRPREGLLKILKGYEDLQGSAPKVSRDNLKDFESDLEPSRGPLENFEDASEGEVKSRAPSGDLNGDQLEAEWARLGPKGAQQRLSQYTIHDYVQGENLYFKPSSFFKFIVCLHQDFDL